MDFVKREWLESVRLFFISFYGIIPYIGCAKNGVSLMIIYHCHLIENTWFLKDLFRKTKAFCAFQVGRLRSVAYTFIEIQLLVVLYRLGRCLK